MSTYSIHFTDTDREKIERLLDFVRSLDFVSSVEPVTEDSVAPTEAAPASISSDQFIPVSELKSLYPNEWVLLANPQKKNNALLGGLVLIHDADKRSFALKAKDLLKKYPGATHFFTGEAPSHARTGLARKTTI